MCQVYALCAKNTKNFIIFSKQFTDIHIIKNFVLVMDSEGLSLSPQISPLDLILSHVRFDVLTVMKVTMLFFWVVMPYYGLVGR
jgi:hypothetical protein